MVQAGRGKKEDKRVRRHGPAATALIQACPQTPSTGTWAKRRTCPGTSGPRLAVGVGQVVVLEQAHDNIPPGVFPPIESCMTDKLPVANDPLDAVFVGQGHAAFEHGAAVGGAGVVAAVVGQVNLARADGDEQDVNRILTEISFRAVQAQAQLALRGQKRSNS